jgi:hypothetical protein
VTYEIYHNIYIYDPVTLWIAYGLAIFFTGLAVVMGSTAMWFNGVAYDTNFSTVLRTSRIYTIAEHDKDAKGSGYVGDDGSRPLPKPLVDAIIITTVAESKRCSKEKSLELKDDVVIEEQVEAVDANLLMASER